MRRSTVEVKRGQVYQNAYEKLAPSSQGVPLREPRIAIQMIDENVGGGDGWCDLAWLAEIMFSTVALSNGSSLKLLG